MVINGEGTRGRTDTGIGRISRIVMMNPICVAITLLPLLPHISGLLIR